jgi:hypothetical protein
MNRVIHLGNAGTGGIECGAKERFFASHFDGHGVNWTWHSEGVTCKRCLKAYRKRVDEARRERTAEPEAGKGRRGAEKKPGN